MGCAADAQRRTYSTHASRGRSLNRFASTEGHREATPSTALALLPARTHLAELTLAHEPLDTEVVEADVLGLGSFTGMVVGEHVIDGILLVHRVGRLHLLGVRRHPQGRRAR